MAENLKQMEKSFLDGDFEKKERKVQMRMAFGKMNQQMILIQINNQEERKETKRLREINENHVQVCSMKFSL